MPSAKPRRAPGPRGLDALRAMRHYSRDPLDYLIKLRRYGDVVRTAAGPFVFHIFYDTRGLRHVFVDHPQRYTKRGVIDELIPVLGDGLVSSEGETWKQRRGAISPGLGRRNLAALVPMMDDTVQAMLAQWHPGDVIDASAAMAHMALAIVGQTLFDVKLAERAPEVSIAVESVSRLALRRRRSFIKLPLSIPTSANLRYRRAIGVLRGQVDTIIADGGERSPFMRLLHEATGGDREALRHEVMTFLLAGHETTASTLAWALGHLARDISLQERARAEARRMLSPGDQIAAPVASFDLIDAITSETLRLYPPGWMVLRRAEEADEVIGYAVPRGSFMVAPVHALHRDPDCWPMPERFDPDRFANGVGSQRDPLMYVPFGLGPRRCIGEGFARLESRVVLARLLDRFSLQLVGDLPPAQPLTTLRPADSIRIKLA